MTIVRKSIPLVLAASLLAGCFDDFFGSSDSSNSTDTDTGEPPPEPPREGFRVFPKYLLQDVPAVVTLERDAIQQACPLDADVGGYLCDATGAPGGNMTITVERDGFDMAVRHPSFYANNIVLLDVHLIPEGGATGVWSECVPAGSFATCGDVCFDQMRACAVTSCASDDPESPVATFESFADAECGVVEDNLALSCDEALPFAPSALRCCCTN